MTTGRNLLARVRLAPLPILYAATLVLAACYCLLKWPIFRGDTDLWYYLSGGRYLFQHRSIAHATYFSFISPVRQWVNYSWLFQALVYTLYLFANYYGLIAFRALLYLGTCWCIGCYLFTSFRKRSNLFWPAFVLTLYALVLLPTHLTVRPQMVTYFFIATFLYILEFNRQRAFILPVLSILWCNIQGIDYPIVLLVTGAYTVEYFINRARPAIGLRKLETAFILPVALSMAAPYFTPFGDRLIGVAFRSLHHLALFVSELRPFSRDDVLSLHVTNLTPSYFTLVNVLLAASSLAFITALFSGSRRASWFFLWIGGAALLLRGRWYLTEAVLLNLPVVAAYPVLGWQWSPKRITRSVQAILLGVTLIMPFQYLSTLREQLGIPRRYPVSSRNLPVGVAMFLNHVKIGGFLLSFPDSSSYLRWMTEPRYKIFVDNVEYPYLFSDRDCYIAQNVFFHAEVLANVLLRYDPSFISVPLQFRQFRQLVRQFPEYVLVFVDDAEVLYVNRRKHSEIAEEYALTQFDPFEMGLDYMRTIREEDGRNALLAQLFKLRRIYPDGETINYLIGSLYGQMGDYENGLVYAGVVQRMFPGSPSGFWLAGNLLRGVKRSSEAIASYKSALGRLDASDAKSRMLFQKTIGSTYFEKGKYKEAYSAFRVGIDVTSPDVTREDLYRFLASAIFSHHTEYANQIAGFLASYHPVIRGATDLPPEN